MRSWDVKLEDIANMENTRRCRTWAGQGKRDRKSVRRFDDDKRLECLVRKVALGAYIPLPPVEFDHHDKGSGKVRHIQDRRVIDLIRKALTIPGRSGLTLGSYLSQWMANFYLSDFDHWVKEDLKVKNYLRYMDDMTLGFSSKRQARAALELITARLGQIGLEVKTLGPGSASIFRWRELFIDMLGYRTYSDGFQELRRRNYLANRRMVDRIEKNGCSRFQAKSLLSRRGFVVHSDCARFLSRIDTLIKEKKIKEITHERIAV